MPRAVYAIQHLKDTQILQLAQLAFGLGCYRFAKYLSIPPTKPTLRVEKDQHLIHLLEAIFMTRDLINMPFQDMTPEHLEQAAYALAQQFCMQIEVVKGQALEQNYPAIHAVGKGSHFSPRLVELRFGDPKHFKLALIGKGVCFDTGGLNIKPSNYMRWMKKDMGGAAIALGLARLIMSEHLPICLRVLLPITHNAVSDQAFHPGDVISTRKGLKIEVQDTDAEGRLILADALSDAAEGNPDLLIDIATLTGSARVALGTDIPVFFASNQELIRDFWQASQDARELAWPLPLHSPYLDQISSKIADYSNAATTPYGGAITAALFLQSFVPHHLSWLHLDLMAFNEQDRPGRPAGGEATGLRALYYYIASLVRRQSY